MSKYLFVLVVASLCLQAGKAHAIPRADLQNLEETSAPVELIIESIDEELGFQLDLVEKACEGCDEEELQEAYHQEYLYYLRHDALDLVDPASRTVVASWYGGGEALSKYTASGDVFNPNAMTAAMRKCPFGTRVKVTNPKNGKSVIVKINDRGPAAKTGASIDLSRAAARKIGINKGKVTIDKC